MRPLHLEMTAFGSYAEKTELPFEQLRHGIYLVTGDTGAGKTTIFDAIVFALYGVPSGSDRRAEMLHCDYVPRSKDTLVTLRFSQDGKEYTVWRRLHFARIRGTKDQYGGAVVSAGLTEPDRAPTEGAGRVTARCEELLGLNAEQFRKIIMLAQGEFMEFLRADSDKKNEILGKLFDNSACLYYQNLLAGARDELKRRRGRSEEELRTLMETVFRSPEDAGQEDYLPGHPALRENLSSLISGEEARLAGLGGEREKLLSEIHALNTRRGAAEAMNALLEEQAKAECRMDELLALDPAMEARRKALAQAEAAYRKAMPALEKADRAAEELRAALAEIDRLGAERERSEREAAEAQNVVNADAPTERELNETALRLGRLTEQLPVYGALREKQREKERADHEALRAAADREKSERERESLDRERAALQKKLDELQSVDGEVQYARTENERAEQTLRALGGPGGLREERNAILLQERTLRTERESFAGLTEAAGEAARRYETLYQHFIAGRAGLLADEVRRTLAERGEAECPVCRSRLCREHLPRLAPLPDETPDEDAVDAAREAASAAEGRRAEQDARVKALAAAAETRKKSAEDRARALLTDGGSWEWLSAEGNLDAAISEAERRAGETERALNDALDRQRERDECLAQRPEFEEKIRLALERIESFRSEEERNRLAAREAGSAVSAQAKQLLYENEDDALAEKERLEQRQAELAREVKAHRDALAEAVSRRDTVRGSLTEKQNSLERLALARDETGRERDGVLSTTGFADREAVERALRIFGGREGDAWLRDEQHALSAHEMEKDTLRTLIEKRRAQTDGHALTDLTELSAAAEALDEKYRRADAAYSELHELLQNHRTVLERVAQAEKALRDTDSAWRRLEELGSLAVGASSERGKLSFDRYVMGTMFREILEMANRRLELMSGGRYELIHRSGADRRNARAGLDIEVLDRNTGRQRPSGSLSGGETFFTSLSLALGLSDVVQNHAGGKRMDALFIDEGFGTLSDDVLDKALEVLDRLSEGDRLVGVISHVDRLDESIPQKIRVRSGEKGSSLSLELA